MAINSLELARVVGILQGDILQVVDRQTYQGIDVLNVYYYRYILVAPAVDPIYDSFKDAFVNTVISAVKRIQITSLTHVSLDIRNLTNGIDVKSYAINVAGQATTTAGIATPSFLSAGFILRRETGLTRNGYKRIAGIPDSLVDGNTFVMPAADKTAIETALAADLNIGVVTSFEPVIYRKGTASVPGLYNSIGQAQYVGLGTQNSRKS